MNNMPKWMKDVYLLSLKMNLPVKSIYVHVSEEYVLVSVFPYLVNEEETSYSLPNYLNKLRG
jgi:hypothetical protein